MNIKFTSRHAFSALTAAFIIHNMEEAIFICRYPVKSPVSFIQPASCHQFLWAVSIISLAGIIAFAVAMRTKKTDLYLFISTSIAAALVLNVLIPHTLVALYTLNYTPGLITAVTLNLPLGLFILFNNKSDCKSRIHFFQYVGIGLAIGYFLFAFIMVLILNFIQ